VKGTIQDGSVTGVLARRPGVPYKRYFWLLTGAWTAVVAGSLAWNLMQHAEEVGAMTSQAARALLEEDLLYREWGILHGGVYVTESTPAERGFYPKEEREITTPSGQALTLLNPAAVSRQVFALQEQQTGIRGHITSLKPIQAANAPDAWERQALEAFGQGLPEVSSIEDDQGERYFRLMRPLVTNPTCLRCHEERDHQVGEIRGGISVTVPMGRFAVAGEHARLLMAHLGLWLAGMAGLVFGIADLRQHLRARQQAEAEREGLIAQLRAVLANVKTLRGLIPICASCKKIRNDQGYWTQLETYLAQHSEAEFSHGLCLECLRKLYPDISDEVEARLAKTSAAPEPPAEKQRAAKLVE
jgi:hypothetical protein